MLVFVENIGIGMIFKGVGWSLAGSGDVGGGPDPKKKGFNRLLIYISNING